MSHRGAKITVGGASALDAGAALLFAAIEHHSILDSFYWAVATATTVGYGDITPHSAMGKGLAIMVMLTIVPLISATFSLFTSGLMHEHVKKSEERIKDHLSQEVLKDR